MKQFKKIITLTLLAVSAFTLFTAASCNTARLEPGGAYAPVGQVPDLAFYQVDAAYDLAYSTIDGVFNFERRNRAALWKISPEIKHTVDKVRPEAWKLNQDYHKARAVYLQNTVPSNLSTLQTILGKMQQLAATATAVVPKS